MVLSPAALGRKVRRVAGSVEAFEILDEAGLESFQTGGCGLLAAAVERAFGLPQAMVASEFNEAEHAVNRAGTGFIDSDGWQSKRQLFQKLDREAGPRKWRITSAKNAFACPVEPVRALARLLSTRGNPGEYARAVDRDLMKLWERFSAEGVDLYISPPVRGLAELGKLVVPKEERGTGLGSQVMASVIAWADKHGVTVTLTPSTDFGGSSVARLKRFYKRFGFVENKGRNRDYEIYDTMYRLPRDT